jgi:hypothetical protein
METLELKSQLHRLIDELDDPNLLDDYFEEMKRAVAVSKTKLWDTLTEEQKREVLLSYEESKDERNLVDHETVMKKYDKWRIK